MTESGAESSMHMSEPTEPNNNAESDGKDEQIAQLISKLAVLESKCDLATKQKELAQKEKEAMVIKYAMSEKNVLEMKQQKEQIEKKLKEKASENEIMQHKVQSMMNEKSRICQMLDSKCYELKNAMQEVDNCKSELGALETKLKWSRNSLTTEMQLHKECQLKVDELNKRISDSGDCAEVVSNLKASQELEQQLKESQASLILVKHERDDKELQIKMLNMQLEKLQNKQKSVLQENNNLSLKVQLLERERLESEQRLSEVKMVADQQRQNSADLQAKGALLDQLNLQLKNEKDQNKVLSDQIFLLKQRNSELESDVSACRGREAELLLFTQQLTDKNVQLQSEFTALETKVQQLSCEQNLVKRALKEQETKNEIFSSQLGDERRKFREEVQAMKKDLAEKSKMCDELRQEVNDHKGENKLIKRKYELSSKEMNKEWQQCRKRLEQYEIQENRSSNGSNSSPSTDRAGSAPSQEQIKVIQPDGCLDRQTLIEHIVKLQRISAKKSEKIDFLEEHINTLVLELQKKSRLLQSYILRDHCGVLTSNTMDNNKANIAKLNGVMASLYSSRITDNKLTLQLSLDINRKLQALLEDALLKNITLKENIDTLGNEIDRLKKSSNLA